MNKSPHYKAAPNLRNCSIKIKLVPFPTIFQLYQEDPLYADNLPIGTTQKHQEFAPTVPKTCNLLALFPFGRISHVSIDVIVRKVRLRYHDPNETVGPSLSWIFKIRWGMVRIRLPFPRLAFTVIPGIEDIETTSIILIFHFFSPFRFEPYLVDQFWWWRLATFPGSLAGTT